MFAIEKQLKKCKALYRNEKHHLSAHDLIGDFLHINRPLEGVEW